MMRGTLVAASLLLIAIAAEARSVSTFSIVARDAKTGELGVAVASRFFSVGSVVPYLDSRAGAVATQANANVTYGPRGLELMAQGATAEETLRVLLRGDENAKSRQVGLVSRDGSSVTHTGEGCNPWAGGRSGPNYAIQGNILTGEDVVVKMERAFLDAKGSLAQRIYAALLAGDAAGGDSRGKQSAALVIVRDKAGFNGGNDRAIDIRVDDDAEPFIELGRLLKYAEMNYAWNEGWTAFTQKRFAEALEAQERAAKLGADVAEVMYDLAVIRLAAGKRAEALEALARAFALNPKLKKQAANDSDLAAVRGDATFERLMR
ncbi:MAG: DUF1028 domain-containing protein [Thermoanaerobaculia bacterium]|nr:DUF1028 domain-containing protein [Thermoanaerobaculia bacterium]